jgi:hypothetical protein
MLHLVGCILKINFTNLTILNRFLDLLPSNTPFSEYQLNLIFDWRKRNDLHVSNILLSYF